MVQEAEFSKEREPLILRWHAWRLVQRPRLAKPLNIRALELPKQHGEQVSYPLRFSGPRAMANPYLVRLPQRHFHLLREHPLPGVLLDVRPAHRRAVHVRDENGGCHEELVLDDRVQQQGEREEKTARPGLAVNRLLHCEDLQRGLYANLIPLCVALESPAAPSDRIIWTRDGPGRHDVAPVENDEPLLQQHRDAEPVQHVARSTGQDGTNGIEFRIHRYGVVRLSQPGHHSPLSL